MSKQTEINQNKVEEDITVLENKIKKVLLTIKTN